MAEASKRQSRIEDEEVRDEGSTSTADAERCRKLAPYIGSKVSLISKSEIRYEGVLDVVDPKELVVSLAKVRTFGTEDRPSDHPMAPRSFVCEHATFKTSDIKALTICETQNAFVGGGQQKLHGDGPAAGDSDPIDHESQVQRGTESQGRGSGKIFGRGRGQPFQDQQKRHGGAQSSGVSGDSGYQSRGGSGSAGPREDGPSRASDREVERAEASSTSEQQNQTDSKQQTQIDILASSVTQALLNFEIGTSAAVFHPLNALATNMEMSMENLSNAVLDAQSVAVDVFQQYRITLAEEAHAAQALALYKCPMCNNDWKKVSFQCGHALCQACATKHHESVKGGRCPVCGEYITKKLILNL